MNPKRSRPVHDDIVESQILDRLFPLPVYGSLPEASWASMSIIVENQAVQRVRHACLLNLRQEAQGSQIHAQKRNLPNPPVSRAA